MTRTVAWLAPTRAAWSASGLLLVEGMNRVLEREGTTGYLLGELGQDNMAGRRFPAYHAIAWLNKEPIATQVLLLLAAVACVLRFSPFDFRRNEWFLAARPAIRSRNLDSPGETGPIHQHRAEEVV